MFTPVWSAGVKICDARLAALVQPRCPDAKLIDLAASSFVGYCLGVVMFLPNDVCTSHCLFVCTNSSQRIYTTSHIFLFRFRLMLGAHGLHSVVSQIFSSLYRTDVGDRVRLLVSP